MTDKPDHPMLVVYGIFYETLEQPLVGSQSQLTEE